MCHSVVIFNLLEVAFACQLLSQYKPNPAPACSPFCVRYGIIFCLCASPQGAFFWFEDARSQILIRFWVPIMSSSSYGRFWNWNRTEISIFDCSIFHTIERFVVIYLNSHFTYHQDVYHRPPNIILGLHTAAVLCKIQIELFYYYVGMNNKWLRLLPRVFLFNAFVNSTHTFHTKTFSTLHFPNLELPNTLWTH